MNRGRLVLILLLGLAAAVFFLAYGNRLSGDDVASLVGLGIVATMIGSWALYEFRANLGESARNLLIWGALTALIALAYTYRGAFGF